MLNKKQEECKHEILFGGMCGTCGLLLITKKKKKDNHASFASIDKRLKVKK